MATLEWTSGSEAFGTARVGLGTLQLQIGFLECFGKRLVFLHLAAVLDGKLIDDNGDKVEEHDSDRQIRDGFGGELVFRKDFGEKRAVGEGSDRAPHQIYERAEVNCGRDDGQEINGIVRAVDSQIAGVVQQKSREQKFYDDAIDGAARGKASDHRTFEKLENHDREEDELLVDLINGRKEGESQEERKPEEINPPYGRLLAV